MDAIGKYYLVLERPCWANNITGHAIYTKETGRKKQKNGIYFYSIDKVHKVGPLTRKQIAGVQKYLRRLSVMGVA